MKKLTFPRFLKASKNDRDKPALPPTKQNPLVIGMKELVTPLLDEKINIENNYIQHLSIINSQLEKENKQLKKERDELLQILNGVDPTYKEKFKHLTQS